MPPVSMRKLHTCFLQISYFTGRSDRIGSHSPDLPDCLHECFCRCAGGELTAFISAGGLSFLRRQTFYRCWRAVCGNHGSLPHSTAIIGGKRCFHANIFLLPSLLMKIAGIQCPGATVSVDARSRFILLIFTSYCVIFGVFSFFPFF